MWPYFAQRYGGVSQHVLKAFVALSERTADGQRLPVDIVAWAEEDAQAQALLDKALRAFTERAAEKGSSVEPMEE